MIDGPTEASDFDRTQENKVLIRQFVEDVLVNGKLDRLNAYFDGDEYVQHNPQIADNLTSLGAALRAMAEAGVAMKYDRIHRVLGEGNFVLVASEGRFAVEHTSTICFVSRTARSPSIGTQSKRSRRANFGKRERQVLTGEYRPADVERFHLRRSANYATYRGSRCCCVRNGYGPHLPLKSHSPT